MEPNVAAYSALWSPNTGIADYGLVTRSLAVDLLETGRGDVKLQFQVDSFKQTPDGRGYSTAWRVRCDASMGAPRKHMSRDAGFAASFISAFYRFLRSESSVSTMQAC